MSTTIAIALLTLTGVDPVIVEPDWTLIRTIEFQAPISARINPIDDLVYVGRRGTSSDGLYRIDAFGLTSLRAGASNVAAVLIDPLDGDAYVSEDFGGVVYRTAFGQTGRTVWVSGFHSGDDDPIGMAIAPATYTGDVLLPGEALLVDRGFNGPDEIWRWSPDVSEGEVLIHADDGTLFDSFDVAIDDDTVYVVDTVGAADGAIYTVAADGSLTALPTLSPLADPVGIAIDPLLGDLVVFDNATGRVVRIDDTGAVSDVVTGLTTGGTNLSPVGFTPDGRRMIVTDILADRIYILARCAPDDPSEDCNGNGVRDLCDIATGVAADCNLNAVPDTCDLASGTSDDCNGDGVPDDCPSCPTVELIFIMDTSASMDDEAAALCGSTQAVGTLLAAVGIDLQVTTLGISNTPGGAYACLEDTVLNVYGSSVPGNPPPEIAMLGACPGGNEVITEDWGVAVAIVAGVKPWLPDSVRLIVPISDEGPWCGDPVTATDMLATQHAITVALDHGVTISPITGTGSGGAVVQEAQFMADGTGGLQFSSSVPDEDIAGAIRDIVLDACVAASDCNGNGTLDSCDIDAGTSLDDDANGIPDECECTGDLDGNLAVDVTDLLLVLGAWGSNDPIIDFAPNGGDGVVDVAELLAVLALWGPC